MVSPYAIRLKASGIEVVGRTAGNLYAVSTVASVAAALLVGFFLIPSVGVTRITLGTGLLLVGTAIYGVAGNGKSKAVLFVLLFAAGAIAVLTLGGRGDKASAEEVVAVEQSAYGEIRVVESEDTRYLLIDGGIHTSSRRRLGRVAGSLRRCARHREALLRRAGTDAPRGIGRRVGGQAIRGRGVAGGRGGDRSGGDAHGARALRPRGRRRPPSTTWTAARFSERPTRHSTS